MAKKATKNLKINVTKESKQLSFNKEDGIKILKGAGIAFGGAFLTYATDLIPLIDWGNYKPIIVTLSAILINAGWKLLRGQKS